MQFNVSQQLKGPVGSTKTYNIEDEVVCPGAPRSAHVEGTVTLMRTDVGILASATLDASVPCTCVRCLSSFDKKSEIVVEEEYVPIEETSDTSTRSALETEGLVIHAQRILDMEPAVREYIILSIPMKPLCKEECAGLCPSCGVNLNEASCSCAKQPESSKVGATKALSSLRDLKTAERKESSEFMGALPKRKTSKARKGKRRTHHGMSTPNLVPCPRCHSAKLPHRVCPACGTYAGQEILQV